MFPPSTRILILDDMSTMRKIVAKNLRELGYTEIFEAVDGKIGWDLLQKLNPPIQFIISDWNMPNATGLDLLKLVRGDARFSKLPFILLTAEAEAHQVSQALVAGVTGYVVKPFTADGLKQAIDKAHKKSAA